MSGRARPLPDVPPPDLTECDREPIHIPGHIQPNGILIATAPASRQITHISANFDLSTGLRAEPLLGTDLAQLVGQAAFESVERLLADQSYAPANVMTLALPFPVRPRRKVLVHRWQARTLVELEDATAYDESAAALSRTQNIIASLRRADTVPQLCTAVVQEVRHLTGYDRVMVYRFDAAGHGTVVAEDRAAKLTPFLNLRYPASDIPQQARRMYVLQRVRAIADTDYAPVPVLSSDGADLDMTYCALRGISPVHLEYMRNMGTRASLSVSLLRGDALWGMIVCHHTTPFATSADLRALCDVIGQLMSVLLQRVDETEALAERLSRGSTIIGLRNAIDEAGSVGAGLHARGDTLLALLNADGAIIRSGGVTSQVGTVPPPVAACAMAENLLRGATDGVGHAGDVGVACHQYATIASGILALRLTDTSDDMVAWFRSELPRTVHWAGDPEKPVRQGDQRLSPRKSFAAWSQLLRGQSAPWTAADLRAAEDLRRAILASVCSVHPATMR